MVAPTRLLTVLAVALSAITALPASADRFEPDPTNCGYTTSHVFHHGNGKSTEVRVTYTSARYTSCDVGKAVARSWATTAGCHDTRYCTVHGNTYSCHNAFYGGSSPIAHCKGFNGGTGEVFMSWHRIDR